MTALAGGVGALVLGLILLIVWWDNFLIVLAGTIPILLLVGGALAAYLGYEERKDQQAIEREMAGAPATPPPPPPPSPSQEEFNRVKEESEKYKKEVADLQKKLKANQEQQPKEE